MKILAIETATESCSAALFVDGAITARERIAPREHATLILAMCDELLTDAGLKPLELDAVAFGRGPGSFTGVRVATGVIQGIAFAAGLPVASVSSLAALAQGALRQDGAERILTAIDARMGEVYWGAFEARGGVVEPVMEESVLAPEAVNVPSQGQWFGVGTGWSSYGEILSDRAQGRLSAVAAERFPLAQDVAVLAARMVERGETVTADKALPVYLRDNVAAKPGKK
jgi:tRNA threonylcarbamoyladenosine biosynthesis protein TsaB